jgi:hypothetical protein
VGLLRAGRAMDLSEKERVEKAALRKRRQQGVAAGTSRFAELEQAVQEIPIPLYTRFFFFSTLLSLLPLRFSFPVCSPFQVLKTPYYRNCKAARNIRRGTHSLLLAMTLPCSHSELR